MAEYKLTNKVVKDLAKIWDYTFEVWSERQADNYYQSLISNCQEIADNPDLGKNYEGITQSLLGLKANRHVIFYRPVNKDYRVIHLDVENPKNVNRLRFELL